MRRIFHDYLENFLAEKILKDEIKKGEEYTISSEEVFAKSL
jgi:ATP-dependent Clp protease ATP-binding subunit ClpA